MKRRIYPLVLLSLLLVGCGGAATSSSQAPESKSSQTPISSPSSEEKIIESVEATVEKVDLKLKQTTEAANYYVVKGVGGKALPSSKRKCTVVSSSPSVCVITGTGNNGDPFVINAISIGEATIIVTSIIDEDKECSFKVVVTESCFDFNLSESHDGDDFSHDSDPEHPWVRTSGRMSSFLFFKDIFSTRSYVESTLKVIGTYDVPLAPKFGFIMQTFGVDTDENNKVIYYLNAEVGTVGDYWDYYGCAEGFGDKWGWSAGVDNTQARKSDKMWTDDHTVTYDQEWKMGMLRDGQDFHFYVDDKYIGTLSGLDRLFLTEGQEDVRLRVGLFEFMSDVIFSDYYVTQDDTVIDEKLAGISQVKMLEWDPD